MSGDMSHLTGFSAQEISSLGDQPKSPESSGTRVIPMRATPPPAISCIIPN